MATFDILDTAKAQASGTSVTATFAASHTAAAGSLLIAVGYTAGFPGSHALGTPSGFTRIGVFSHFDNKQLSLDIKKAVGTETGVTYSKSGTSQHMNCHVIEMELDEATIDDLIDGTIDMLETYTGTNAAGNSVTTPGIDPSATGNVFFFVAAIADTAVSSVAWDNSFTVLTSEPSTGRTWTGYRIINNPGSTSTTASYTGTSTSRLAYIAAIPAPTSSGATVNADVATATAAAGDADFTTSLDVEVTVENAATATAIAENPFFGAVTFAKLLLTDGVSYLLMTDESSKLVLNLLGEAIQVEVENVAGATAVAIAPGSISSDNLTINVDAATATSLAIAPIIITPNTAIVMVDAATATASMPSFTNPFNLGQIKFKMDGNFVIYTPKLKSDGEFTERTFRVKVEGEFQEM